MIPEGRRLEGLAERLRSVQPLMPSPAAKIRGWNLVAASLERSTVRPRGSSMRRLVLAAVAVAVLLVAGGVAASASSLPDSPLYPMKTALEQLRGTFAFTASDRLAYHLDLAQTRLTEAEAMMASHRIDLAAQALGAMELQLDDAAAVVATQQQADPVLAAGLQSRLQQAITVHDAQLAQLQGQVSNPAAIAAITDARARAQQSLARVNGATNNGNNGNPNPGGGNGQGQPSQSQGQGQSNRGVPTPHPTPKK